MIVLVWNVAMLVEAWIAFGGDRKTNRDLANLEPGSRWTGVLAYGIKGLFWACVLLPIGERWSVFDAWPSHALYASHVGRVEIFVHESERESYPESVRRRLTLIEDGPWHRLDQNGWSRDLRGTPVYPGIRGSLGLAEALAARYGVRGLVRVAEHGPAHPWTGQRTSRERIGLQAIRREGDRFFVNAHPAP